MSIGIPTVNTRRLLMDYFGTVSEMTSDGRAVTVAAAPPEMGDPVFDDRKHNVGKIIRIFGPVDAPYVSIKADGPSSLNIGMELYTQKVRYNGKNKRRY